MSTVVATLKDPHVCQPGCPDWPADAAAPEAEAPKAGPSEREQLFHWSPSRTVILRALAVAGSGAAILGLIGFALSFQAVSAAARPYMGQTAAMLPIIIDLGIAVLTALSLVLALAGMPSRLISAVPTVLSAYTLYLNVAEQHTLYGAVIHGAGPGMWITVVELGGLTVRKLVGLHNRPPAIEKVRPSLWLFRPLPTLRLWRQMRVQQIPTYKGARAREGARALLRGQMRLLHGRFWRFRAPLDERIALRFQDQDVTGVAVELDAHREKAALLSGTVRKQAEAAPDAAEPPAPAVEPVPAPVPAQAATAPVAPTAAKGPRAPRPQTPGAGRVRTVTTLTDAELVDAAEAIERAALAASGGASGASYRAAQAELHVGYGKAKTALDAARERIARTPLHLVQDGEDEGRGDAEAVA